MATMTLFSASDRRIASAIAQLTYCNPFRPRRIELERAALGGAYVDASPPWNTRGDVIEDHPNVVRLLEKARALAEQIGSALRSGTRGSDEDLRLYEDVVVFVLYHAWRHRFDGDEGRPQGRKASRRRVEFFDAFNRDVAQRLVIPGLTLSTANEIPHLFACYYQVARAFHSIFRCVIGGSEPTWRFRAAVWESVFTHDLRRYRRVLYARMADFVTLITGPSGSGKELAARAVGLSRYVPFDETGKCFAEDVASSFYPLNLSALSPSLIESELFGHRRGAFTGAGADTVGWLETCPALGTIFLDEIGELDALIQVKLLRVLQSRSFNRMGETIERRFRGKLVVATNRDLGAAMRSGSVREDFYYRLCSDIIEVPSLHERLAADPEELGTLLHFIATRLLPGEAEALASEAREYILEHLGEDYPWPGNVRELEQCVSNVLVRKSYRVTASSRAKLDDDGELLALMRRGDLTADELLCRYCAMAYERSGSLEETARRLDIDRRTVRAKVKRNADAAMRNP